MKPQLDDYAFPEFMTEQRLARALAPDRIERIRHALTDPGPAAMIQYKVPWFDATVVDAGGAPDEIYERLKLALG